MVLKSNAKSSKCEKCKMEDQLLANDIRFSGKFNPICTACILRLHRQSFCPTCYRVYPPPPPNDAVLNCFKCGSLSHSRCVDAPSKPYICPLCVDSKSKSKMKEKEDFKGFTFLDLDTRKKVVAAARIVAALLEKAAAAARAELERKISKVVLLKKTAKEAFELCEHLVMEEKLGKKESTSSMFASSSKN